jgi:hypothetical protein
VRIALKSTQVARKAPSRQCLAGRRLVIHERARPAHRGAKLMPARLARPPVMNLIGAHVLGVRRRDDQILAMRAEQSRNLKRRVRRRRRCSVVLHATVLSWSPVTLTGQDHGGHIGRQQGNNETEMKYMPSRVARHIVVGALQGIIYCECAARRRGWRIPLVVRQPRLIIFSSCAAAHVRGQRRAAILKPRSRPPRFATTLLIRSCSKNGGRGWVPVGIDCAWMQSRRQAGNPAKAPHGQKTCATNGLVVRKVASTV